MDNTGKRLILIAILMLCVFIGAAYIKRDMSSGFTSAYVLPDKIMEWRSQDLDVNVDSLRSELGAQSILFRSYSKQDRSVTLYLAYYKDVDSANRVHSPTVCYPGQGWVVAADNVVYQVIEGKKVGINRLIVEKGKEKDLVYNWWQTGRSISPKNSTNRFYQMYKSVMGDNPSTVWVRLSVEFDGSLGSAEAEISKFAVDVIPLIECYFRR